MSETLRLPPMLFAPIGYYARMACADRVVIDESLLFDKRFKAVHRYDIASMQGRLSLTIPIIKPHDIPYARWEHVRISPHGNWWKVHRTTLQSAYARTPYFQYLFPKFEPCFQPPDTDTTVVSLFRYADQVIRDILMIENVEVAYTQISQHTHIPNTTTYGAAAPWCSPTSIELPNIQPYYQITQEKFGFIPDLSVLDLIFNLGPDAVIYLDNIKERYLTRKNQPTHTSIDEQRDALNVSAFVDLNTFPNPK